MLRPEVKNELLWHVDRTSPSDKIRDFVARCRVIIADMDYIERINNFSVVTRTLVRYSQWWDRGTVKKKKAGMNE